MNPGKNRRRKAIFDEDEEQDVNDHQGGSEDDDSNDDDDGEENIDPAITINPNDIGPAFTEGVKEAKKVLRKATGFKPSRRRGQPELPSWEFPENFDPKNDKGYRNEEQMHDEYKEDDASAEEKDEQKVDQNDQEDHRRGWHNDYGGPDSSDDEWSGNSEHVQENEPNEGAVNVPDEDANAAAEILLASVVPMKVSLTVKRIDENKTVQEVHKAVVCKEINKGRAKISADRFTRIMNAQKFATSNGQANDFNISEDAWVVGLHNDVAIQYNNMAQVARIVRMRKKVGKTWVNYRKPFVLHTDRTPLGNLHVQFYCYKRVRGGPGKLFKFNTPTLDERHVTEIICPVTMTLAPATGLYTLYYKHDRLITLNLQGDTTWDAEVPL